jgi:hypothetical protein
MRKLLPRELSGRYLIAILCLTRWHKLGSMWKCVQRHTHMCNNNMKSAPQLYRHSVYVRLGHDMTPLAFCVEHDMAWNVVRCRNFV